MGSEGKSKKAAPTDPFGASSRSSIAGKARRRFFTAAVLRSDPDESDRLPFVVYLTKGIATAMS